MFGPSRRDSEPGGMPHFTRVAALQTSDLLRLPGGGARPAGGLPELLQLLSRYKTRLLTGALCGLLAGICVYLLSPPLYQARVALQIQNANADFLDARSINSVAESSAADSGSLTDVATELKIIESDDVLDRAIAKLQAEGKAGPLQREASRRSLLSRVLHRPAPTGATLLARMREAARPNLSVKQIGPTRAVEIVYRAASPEFAALLANTLALEYIDRGEEARWNKSRRTEASLSRELDDVRGRLKLSQDALQHYAAGTGLLFVNGRGAAVDSGDVSEDRLGQLQQETSLAQADRIAAQSHYEIAHAANPASVGDVLNDPRLRELNERLTELKRQRADLLTIYTGENDKVRRVVAQIAPLEAEFVQQRSSVMARIEQEYLTARRREYLLQLTYNAQKQVVERKEGETIQYSILRQDVDSNQKLYDSVFEQVKRAGIASAVRSNNIEVFDPATPPVKPASPRPVLLGGLGLAGGVLAACLFTLLTESSDRRLQGPGELQGRLNLRELGVLPSNPSGGHLGVGSRRPPPAIDLVTWSKPQSLADEAYRGLLTSILYASDGGPSPRTMVITSANPGEGKTTTACNLGVMLAELTERVLLIDADLRRPQMHHVFGKALQPGLSDLLSGQPQGRYPHEAIQPTFVPNLFLLPSGILPRHSMKLLHSEQLETLLGQLRESFSVILIDTSPSLLTADARILGRSADAVILVTRAGVTTCGDAEATAAMFAADGSRVLGTVLNDVKAPRSNYTYYAAAAANQEAESLA